MSLMLHRTGLLEPSLAAPATSVPEVFQAGDWSLAPGDEEAHIEVHALPHNGGAPISDIEYRLNGGTWTSSGGTTSFAISGLTRDEEYDVELRAVNSVGPGAASDTKSVSLTSAGPDLTAGLVSFWELEEASGTRFDSHGSNHLTANNSVGQGTGQVGSAADFDGSTQSLSIADNSSLSYSGDFSIAFWVRYDVIGGWVLTKRNGTFAQDEWGFGIYFSGTSRLGFYCWNNSGSNTAVGTLAPSINTWYFVVATYTASNRAITFSVNAGTRETGTLPSTALGDKTGPFSIGARWNGGSSVWADFFNGRVDQVGFWKRALAEEDEAWLHNSGNGRSYAEVLASAA